MSDLTAIARPYAKAIFDLAAENGDYDSWGQLLDALAAAIAVPEVYERLDDPGISDDQWAQAMTEALGETSLQQQNLIQLLAENDRLQAVPEISGMYNQLRAEAEQTLDVEVTSATALSDAQKAQLTQRLQARFGRDIRLSVEQDAELMGGLVIRAGDTVIDGSVKSRLEQLASAMVR